MPGVGAVKLVIAKGFRELSAAGSFRLVGNLDRHLRTRIGAMNLSVVGRGSCLAETSSWIRARQEPRPTRFMESDAPYVAVHGKPRPPTMGRAPGTEFRRPAWKSLDCSAWLCIMGPFQSVPERRKPLGTQYSYEALLRTPYVEVAHVVFSANPKHVPPKRRLATACVFDSPHRASQAARRPNNDPKIDLLST
jgi:hypothetical protein